MRISDSARLGTCACELVEHRQLARCDQSVVTLSARSLPMPANVGERTVGIGEDRRHRLGIIANRARAVAISAARGTGWLLEIRADRPPGRRFRQCERCSSVRAILIGRFALRAVNINILPAAAIPNPWRRARGAVRTKKPVLRLSKGRVGEGLRLSRMAIQENAAGSSESAAATAISKLRGGREVGGRATTGSKRTTHYRSRGCSTR